MLDTVNLSTDCFILSKTEAQTQREPKSLRIHNDVYLEVTCDINQ